MIGFPIVLGSSPEGARRATRASNTTKDPVHISNIIENEQSRLLLKGLPRRVRGELLVHRTPPKTPDNSLCTETNPVWTTVSRGSEHIISVTELAPSGNDPIIIGRDHRREFEGGGRRVN